MRRRARLSRVLSALVVAVGALAGVGAGSARAASGTIGLDGTPVTVTITTTGVNGHYKFTGAPGLRIFAELTGSTFGPHCPAVLLQLVRPDGTAFGTPASTCGANAFLDTQTLDQTGTWQLLVNPQHSDVGSATLRAWAVPPDQSSAITLNAAATAVSLDTPGKNGRFTFTPTFGHAVSAELSGASFTGACPTVAVALLRPDGTQASSTTTCSDSAFLESTTVDQAGTWTALVDPQLDSTGTGGLQVFDATDQQGTVTTDGTAVGVELTEPGQNGDFAFTGTSGQKISATTAAATFPGCAAYTLSLVRPDGSTLASPTAQCGGTGFLDGEVLDQSGTWTLHVDPQGTATGSAQLSVYDATDQVRTVNVGGPAVVTTLSVPGRNGLLQFDGTSGTTIAAQVTGATFTGVCPTFAFSLVRPDGSTLGSPATSCTDTAALAAQTLDQTGTWTLLVDAQGPATGTASVQAFSVTNEVRAITLNGARLGFHLSQMQDADFTFSGATGQAISALVSKAVFTGCPGYTLALVRPDATQLGSKVDGCDTEAFLDAVTLDQSGTWTLVVHPVGGPVDGAIQAYTFTDLAATADLSGKSTKLVFQHPGQNAAVGFKGTNGLKISAVISDSNVTGGGCPAVSMTLLHPGNGAVYAGPVTTCSDSAFLDTVTLNARGTWQLEIDPQGPGTGTLRVSVYAVVDDVRTIPIGTLRSFTAQQPGANGVFHFKGAPGQTRQLAVSWSTFSGCPGVVVSFLRPDGSVLASTDGCDPDFVLGPVTLDAQGTWTVFVDPQGPGEGTMVLKLTS